MAYRNSTLFVLAAILCASGAGPDSLATVETFEGAPVGAVAPGFTSETGRWVVVDLPEGGKAFAQTAESPDKDFNAALRTRSSLRNLDLSVRLRALAGKNDQGGGLVWRARDAKNYYIARYNPLEDNFRVYKVVNGERTQLQSADVKRTEGWHTLRVRMVNDRIRCDLDGKTLLDVADSTFHDRAGMIGLWTAVGRADAV